MRRPAILVLFVLSACAGATRTNDVIVPGPDGRTPAEVARADGGIPPYTRADVEFMSNMIAHHAQAVVIAGWAPTHGASAAVRGLAERIVVAQQDEIAFLRRWLADRNEAVPAADAMHDHAGGHMPGMLSREQLEQLDGARGTSFDRLFLTFMIQHHEGAITMVEQLMGAHGAAQDDDVFKFAADVHVDQITEIDRMRVMLDALPAGGNNP